MQCYTEILHWNSHFCILCTYLSFIHSWSWSDEECMKSCWNMWGYDIILMTLFPAVSSSSKARHQFWVGTGLEMVIMHLISHFLDTVSLLNIILCYFPVNSWIACLFYLSFVFPLKTIGIFLKGRYLDTNRDNFSVESTHFSLMLGYLQILTRTFTDLITVSKFQSDIFWL